MSEGHFHRVTVKLGLGTARAIAGLLAETLPRVTAEYEPHERMALYELARAVSGPVSGAHPLKAVLARLEEDGAFPCFHERTRMDDGISSCLDCGDRLDCALPGWSSS
jgi:hypothetical protein